MSTTAASPQSITAAPLPPEVRVAIVGSGFSGLGMAHGLLEDGERNFVILEQADDIGGTWRDNVYPGCACVVPWHMS
jgi:cation diffusion facilitator CzcD-associated flavoprotein CzcO